MKRTKFITALVTLLTAPVFAFSKVSRTNTREKKGFKISAGESRIHGHI